MRSVNRSAITVIGTEDFLAYIKILQPQLKNWTLAQLNHHPSVYMIDTEDQNCWGNAFYENYQAIFEEEIVTFLPDKSQIPKISLQQFKSWFTFVYHEIVYDLSKEALGSD